MRKNALQHLHQEIPLTKKKGSFTLEETLVQLIRSGQIEREDALVCSIHPDDLDILLKSSSASASAYNLRNRTEDLPHADSARWTLSVSR